MELTFASLMARAFDEPDAVYLLAAEELSVSPDGLVFRFRLRPGIVFHDGSEITRIRRGVFADDAEEQGASGVLFRAPRSRRADRRGQADGPVALPADARPRRAGARSGDADLFREVLFDAAVRRDLAGCATGVRALSRCAFRAGPIRRIRACEELVGREASGLRAVSTISTRCGTSITVTAKPASRPLPAATICSAKSSPRASGRRATISPRFATDASSGMSFPTSVPPARRAGCSIPGGTNLGIGAFARR